MCDARRVSTHYSPSRAQDLERITLDAIAAASERITPYVRRTPLARSETFSRMLGAEIYLKLELFQKTGAFKVRGAFNKMLGLARGSRVVAVSGGNHAQAVAYAGAMLGMTTRIYMPANTPANYLDATRGYGAEVELRETIAAAFAGAQADEGEGWVLVHPFDDPEIIAGQGTMGLEIVEELPAATDVIVSIAGGGMATGVAVAVKQSLTRARMWGVETEGADCMSRALAAGHPVRMEAITSIAKTLGAPSASELTLAAVQKYFEAVEVVSDVATVGALDLILERAKVLCEPAAACTWVAAERLGRAGHFGPDSHVVLVLCGGNVAVRDLCGYPRAPR